MLDAILNTVDQNQSDAIERLSEFLRIPSISTDPAYASHVKAAAEWASAELAALGFESSVVETEGHPMVLAHYRQPSTKTLLFYGHYDVQPVDPVELWQSEPFSPTIRETEHGKALYARGASDDKGQLLTFVEACRAIIDVEGSLPCSVTVFLEGEEECGSPSMHAFLASHRDALKADLGLICDTSMFDRATPSIVTMLRGMVSEEVRIIGPDKDLHSGMFGGPAVNPLRVLSQILASLHDENGRVTLPDFYEGVSEIDATLKSQWQSLNFNASEFLGQVGLSHPAGENNYSALEQIWSRPTCEINGIEGGYTGDGFKTVIPSRAKAKVSFRLVGDQDPLKIRDRFREHVQANLPNDCRAEFVGFGCDSATVMPTDGPAFATIARALSDEWDKDAVFEGCGGSIPIAGLMKTQLGLTTALVGFAHDDDAIHSPNEKYDLRSFHKGTRSWARIIKALAQQAL